MRSRRLVDLIVHAGAAAFLLDAVMRGPGIDTTGAKLIGLLTALLLIAAAIWSAHELYKES